MTVTTNVTIALIINVTLHKELEQEDQTSRLDWLIPTIVNLVSLVHYGLTTRDVARSFDQLS